MKKYPKLAKKWRGILLNIEPPWESNEAPIFNRFIKSKIVTTKPVDGNWYDLRYLDLRNNVEESNRILLEPFQRRAIYRVIEHNLPVLLAEGLISHDGVPKPFLIACFALNKERDEFWTMSPTCIDPTWNGRTLRT